MGPKEWEAVEVRDARALPFPCRRKWRDRTRPQIKFLSILSFEAARQRPEDFANALRVRCVFSGAAALRAPSRALTSVSSLRSVLQLFNVTVGAAEAVHRLAGLTPGSVVQSDAPPSDEQDLDEMKAQAEASALAGCSKALD
jgi:hypothetical protein